MALEDGLSRASPSNPSSARLLRVSHASHTQQHEQCRRHPVLENVGGEEPQDRAVPFTVPSAGWGESKTEVSSGERKRLPAEWQWLTLSKSLPAAARSAAEALTGLKT